MKRVSLYRWLAVVVLLLACTDGVFPESSSERVESAPGAVPITTTPSRDALTHAPATPKAISPSQPAPGGQTGFVYCDGDCICCGHAAPGTSFRVTDYFGQRLPPRAARLVAPQSPPRQAPYHPPRLS